VYHPHITFHNLDMPALATLNQRAITTHFYCWERLCINGKTLVSGAAPLALSVNLRSPPPGNSRSKPGPGRNPMGYGPCRFHSWLKPPLVGR